MGSLSTWEQNHQRLVVLTREELDQAKPQPGDGKAWGTGSTGSRPPGKVNKELGYEEPLLLALITAPSLYSLYLQNGGRLPLVLT